MSIFYYEKQKDVDLPPPRIIARTLSEESGARVKAIWQHGNRMVDYLGMCALYEKSYQVYFDKYPHVLNEIAAHGEVYDVEPRDLQAGADLDQSDAMGYVHIQDIVARRCLARAGLKFLGESKDLLRIRTTSISPLGRSLSPFHIMFYEPKWITDDNTTARVSQKCLPGSVESYYHYNKRLSVENISAEDFTAAAHKTFGDALILRPPKNTAN